MTIKSFIKKTKYKDEHKSINPLTGTFYKLGDTREEDNKIFFCYRGELKKNGMLGEQWMEPEKFKKKLEHRDKRNAKVREEYQSNKFPNRLNPKTGKEFQFGDEINGEYFIEYRQENDHETGFRKEGWGNKDDFINKRFARTVKETRRRANKQGVPHDIDWKYIKSIFPKNYKCPVLGIKMEFGQKNNSFDNSPSLDKIIPQKGYVKDNVVWISMKANQIKSNGSDEEVMRVAIWLKKINEKGSG